jgi:hypothetical protein
MSKLKTKIKIGYADIEIKLLSKKESPKWCKDHFGEYDSSKSQILLNNNLTKIEEANTFIHELLHASIWISGLSAEGGVLEPKKREEIVVNVLANSLAQIFRDNSWVLPYLNKGLKGTINSEQKAGDIVLGRDKKQYKKRTFSKNRKPNRAWNS